MTFFYEQLGWWERTHPWPVSRWYWSGMGAEILIQQRFGSKETWETHELGQQTWHSLTRRRAKFLTHVRVCALAQAGSGCLSKSCAEEDLHQGPRPSRKRPSRLNSGNLLNGLHPEKHVWQIKRGYHPSLFRAAEATPVILCPVLGPSVQKGCGKTGEGSWGG